MSLNQSVKPLPAAGLRSNCSAWPPASRRRDELKHKASINIKVHRPHRAAKEHTVNLSVQLQTARRPSRANVRARWCCVSNEIISRTLLFFFFFKSGHLRESLPADCACAPLWPSSTTHGEEFRNRWICMFGGLSVKSPWLQTDWRLVLHGDHAAWADWNTSPPSSLHMDPYHFFSGSSTTLPPLQPCKLNHNCNICGYSPRRLGGVEGCKHMSC